jgi:hypothetical protein
MLEAGEDLHFAFEALLGRDGQQRRDELDRHQLLHAIRTLG